MPLRRPAIMWYQERVEPITQFFGERIKAMISDRNINNVSNIACVSEASQQFEQDMIHLTKTSAKVFLEVTLAAAETFFNSDLVDLTKSGEVRGEDDQSDSEQICKLENRLKRSERLMRLQADKNVSNDLMFARGIEETDASTNKVKEDRIILNGLKSSTPLPADPRVRIEALKTIAAEIFEKMIPGFTGKIIYLSQGKSQGQPLPMVEVRLDSVEKALRKSFTEMRKKKSLDKELESLFVSNSVSLAPGSGWIL